MVCLPSCFDRPSRNIPSSIVRRIPDRTVVSRVRCGRCLLSGTRSVASMPWYTVWWRTGVFTIGLRLSWSPLDGTMIASVVALGDLVENVDPVMSLMTGQVTEEFGLQRLDASFGIGTLLFVLCVEVVHSFGLQEALHVFVPEFDALVSSQFGGFPPRRNKICSTDDISLPRVERKGNVCAKREKTSMATTK